MVLSPTRVLIVDYDWLVAMRHMAAHYLLFCVAPGTRIVGLILLYAPSTLERSQNFYHNMYQF